MGNDGTEVVMPGAAVGRALGKHVAASVSYFLQVGATSAARGAAFDNLLDIAWACTCLGAMQDSAIEAIVAAALVGAADEPGHTGERAQTRFDLGSVSPLRAAV